jgi:hypothetical protein
MHRIAQHKILVSGESYEHCCQQVHKFFDLTSLVIYDCIQVIDDKCRSGLDAGFFTDIAAAEQKNRKTVNSLIEELQQTGVQSITDLKTLEHGYPSKVLHILSHLLDGFIGIDSFFYNMLTDSHWLQEIEMNAINDTPADFWLIHIDCYSASPEEADILHK